MADIRDSVEFQTWLESLTDADLAHQMALATRAREQATREENMAAQEINRRQMAR